MSVRLLPATACRVAIAAAVTAALFAASSRAGGVQGTFDSPLGKLVIVEKDGIVTGRTAQGGGPCGFPKGKAVIEGTRLDDNVTGALHACKVGDGCAGALDGMVMLLITRSGSVMSGAVHLDAGTCKTPVGGDGITLKKIAAKGADTKSPNGDTGDKGTLRGKGPKGPSTKGKDPERGPAKGGPHKRAKAEALAGEGARLLEVGSIEEARAKFLEATRLDPAYSEGFVGVGVTYYMRDRYDEALDFYKQGLEANPGNRDAYYNMACVYALKGETEQAIRYLQIAVLNGYVQLDTLTQDPDLKSLHGNPDFEKLKSGGL